MIEETDYKELMELVAKFHSILSTAWPKPGEPALAGASVFIGTTLFKCLENGLSPIEVGIGASNNASFKQDLRLFWKTFEKLFVELGKQDRNTNSEQVDFTFNLLFFASGVFYHRLEELSVTHSNLEKDFIRMKSFGELVVQCHWPGRSDSVKAVFDSLIGEMARCAKNLL